MTHLEIIFLSIDQYIQKQQQRTQNTFQNGCLSSLFCLTQCFNTNKKYNDQFHMAYLENIINSITNENNLKLFILGYIFNNKTLIESALINSNETINLELLLYENQNNELKQILKYNLSYFLQMKKAQSYLTENNQFKEENVCRIIPNFETPLIHTPTEKEGKQKFFDSQGFVYAKNDLIAMEFIKESTLENYVLETASLSKDFSLLDKLSFQEQDPNYPKRARVEMYKNDVKTYFGFETLDDFLAKASERKYSENQIIQVITQLLDITHQLYLSGISHRDLHAGNIKIIPDGPFNNKQTNFKVKVFDFGNSEYNLAKNNPQILADWNYTLLKQSDNYSDQVGRYLASFLPIETDTHHKHYPIFKLLALINPDEKLFASFSQISTFFIDSLRHCDQKKETLDYLYNNFKYNLLSLIKEKKPAYTSFQKIHLQKDRPIFYQEKQALPKNEATANLRYRNRASYLSVH